MHTEIDEPLYPSALMHMWCICVPLRLEVTPLIYLKDRENSLIAHTDALIGHVTYNLHMSKLTALTFVRKIPK